MNDHLQSSGVLPRSPLIFVLAQVRISPVLLMKDKIPAIQEELRKCGFPNFSARRIEQTRLEAGNQVRFDSHEQWEFIDSSRQSAVLVDHNAVVYQTTRYETFAPFIEKLMTAVEIVHRIAAPSQSLRFGIRYIDLITSEGGHGLDYYVRREMRGPSYECGSSFVKMTETILQTDPCSKMVVRYVEAPKAAVAFPAELQPINLEFKRSLTLAEPFGLLDLDHFEEKTSEFSLDTIRSTADKLHVPLDVVFKQSVTSEAFAEWGKPL